MILTFGDTSLFITCSLNAVALKYFWTKTQNTNRKSHKALRPSYPHWHCWKFQNHQENQTRQEARASDRLSKSEWNQVIALLLTHDRTQLSSSAGTHLPRLLPGEAIHTAPSPDTRSRLRKAGEASPFCKGPEQKPCSLPLASTNISHGPLHREGSKTCAEFHRDSTPRHREMHLTWPRRTLSSWFKLFLKILISQDCKVTRR